MYPCVYDFACEPLQAFIKESNRIKVVLLKDSRFEVWLYGLTHNLSYEQVVPLKPLSEEKTPLNFVLNTKNIIFSGIAQLERMELFRQTLGNLPEFKLVLSGPANDLVLGHGMLYDTHR